MTASPPLRLLACVVGGWVGLRGAMMAWEALGVTPQVAIAGAPVEAARLSSDRDFARRGLIGPQRRAAQLTGQIDGAVSGLSVAEPTMLFQMARRIERPALPAQLRPDPLPTSPLASFPPAMPPPQPRGARGWSVYGWMFVRDGVGRALASDGSLGGSQAGVRAVVGLTDRLAAAVRFSTPLAGSGAEAAVGLEWSPVAEVPVRVLAERRQRLDRGGRSAFALTLHGGVDPTRVGPVEVEAYGQAGVVGLRSRDLFVDGAVAGGVPIGHSVRIGAGVWGAAQPGAARLDIGPQVVTRVPLGQVGLRVAAEWRLRVAGDAAPASGPALTLSAGF